jgi:hypothetical protein
LIGFISDLDVMPLLRKVTYNPCPLAGPGYHFEATAQLLDARFHIRESMTLPSKCRNIEPHPIIFHDQPNPPIVELE